MPKMIIGLTGTIASGKTTVAEILKKKGFSHYTYSDILREEAKKRDIIPTRENLQKLGNQVKTENQNPGILSKLIVERSHSKNILADGIRTLDEIHELRKYPHSFILGIDAPQKIRYERLKARNRSGDPLSFKEFKEIDDHENQGLTPGQDINNCLKNADYLILNNKSEADLKIQVDSILEKLLIK
ncbi:MAG: AAA family ATPase [Candidatus Woesearchaeota archaeon]